MPLNKEPKLKHFNYMNISSILSVTFPLIPLTTENSFSNFKLGILKVLLGMVWLKRISKDDFNGIKEGTILEIIKEYRKRWFVVSPHQIVTH